MANYFVNFFVMSLLLKIFLYGYFFDNLNWNEIFTLTDIELLVNENMLIFRIPVDPFQSGNWFMSSSNDFKITVKMILESLLEQKLR